MNDGAVGAPTGETMERRNWTKHDSRRGSAMLISLVALAVVAGMAGSLLSLSLSRHGETTAVVAHSRARYIAEAGLSESIAAVESGANGNFGSSKTPIALGGGAYYSNAVDNKDGTYTVTSFGSHEGRSIGLEATLVKSGGSIYNSALFAGNTSHDPLYDMKFGGTGKSADLISGNIFSGGNVVISGTAKINGTIEATGKITGGTGKTGQTVPVPDISGMNYAANNNFNVAALFKSATYGTAKDGAGGSAWQMPQSSPAHIFRKNPSDRTANTSTTAKDDYFLEDPYGTITTSNVTDAAHASQIHISGVDGAPGANGNNAVYYIDGNLWIHNLNAYSFTFQNAKGTPTDITLVVNGNIYISDNILYNDKTHDGVALISIKDPKVSDSGNIYFGDPTFGTLEQMDSFMYAENNFKDNNLSATGSAIVTVNGNMTAGNQVNINRDVGLVHSKLTVNYDDRIATGKIRLPGLPSSGSSSASWTVAAWREIPTP